MNDKQMEKKIQRDTKKIKKDVDTLMSDGVTRISRGLEKMSVEARETLTGAADNVKKEVGQGLSQYNTKVHEFAKKAPGDWNQKIAKYPWVAISIGLGLGLLLGVLLKPSRRF